MEEEGLEEPDPVVEPDQAFSQEPHSVMEVPQAFVPDSVMEEPCAIVEERCREPTISEVVQSSVEETDAVLEKQEPDSLVEPHSTEPTEETFVPDSVVEEPCTVVEVRLQ